MSECAKTHLQQCRISEFSQVIHRGPRFKGGKWARNEMGNERKGRMDGERLSNGKVNVDRLIWD